MKATILYFAYGSNLLAARLLERTPSAQAMGPAWLPGYSLRWHKRGADGSGKCDVVRDAAPSSGVWGALWRLRADEKPLLDLAEALGVGYRDAQVMVQQGAAPGVGASLQAWVYLGLDIDLEAVPYDWYHALVLQGALEQGLDAAYVERLRGVQRKSDPDTGRADRHFRLLSMRR